MVYRVVKYYQIERKEINAVWLSKFIVCVAVKNAV